MASTRSKGPPGRSKRAGEDASDRPKPRTQEKRASTRDLERRRDPRSETPVGRRVTEEPPSLKPERVARPSGVMAALEGELVRERRERAAEADTMAKMLLRIVELEAKAKRVDALEGAIATVEKSRDELAAKANEANAALVEAESRMALAKNAAERSNEKARVAEERALDAVMRASTTANELRAREEEVATLSAKLDDHKSRLAKAEAQIAQLSQRIVGADALLDELRGGISEVHAKASSSEQALREAQARATALEAEAASAKARASEHEAALTAEKAAHAKTAEARAAEKAAHAKESEELLVDKIKHDKELDKARNDYERISRELARAAAIRDKNAQERDEARKSIEAATTAHAKAIAELESTNAKAIAELESKNAALLEEQKGLEARLAKANHLIDRAKEVLEELHRREKSAALHRTRLHLELERALEGEARAEPPTPAGESLPPRGAEPELSVNEADSDDAGWDDS